MAKNILIAGGAGYIGGSLVADLLAQSSDLFSPASLSTTVRTQEQAQALSKLGINVIQIDLDDLTAVTETVIRNKIDIVVNVVTSFSPPLVTAFIKGLGQRRKATGESTYFVQTSVTAIYSELAGWPYGERKDSDSIYQLEKQMDGFHPIRQANLTVVEEAKAHGVTSFNIPIPTVYGRGTGEWRKLSVSIPAYIRTSIEHKVVYKFDVNGSPPATHISDLTALCVLLLEKILQNDPIPSNEDGLYYAMAHRCPWWPVMQGITDGLYARGLVTDSKPQIWPSDATAAQYLGFPVEHVRAMGINSGGLVPINAFQIGWKPKWDEERFLQSIDDEVQAVLDLDKHKATVFNKLLDPPS